MGPKRAALPALHLTIDTCKGNTALFVTYPRNPRHQLFV